MKLIWLSGLAGLVLVMPAAAAPVPTSASPATMSVVSFGGAAADTFKVQYYRFDDDGYRDRRYRYRDRYDDGDRYRDADRYRYREYRQRERRGRRDRDNDDDE